MRCASGQVFEENHEGRQIYPGTFSNISLINDGMNEWMTHTSYHTFNLIRLLILIDIFNTSIVLVDIETMHVKGWQTIKIHS